VRIRSFTVPPGSRFVCVPIDGGGPLIAESGSTVTVAVGDTWEQTADAIRVVRDQAQPEANK
jgi:hypothetical protein